MTHLPTLYKPTKTGKTQVCKISYEDDQFFVEFGQLEGKMQTKSTTCSSKNVGRSNETTASQQTESEAKAKWKQKVKSGYSESQTSPSAVQLPQKVKVLQDHINKLEYPCTSTPKLNGVNATYWLQDDKTLKLTSRGGDEYPSIPHLAPQILDLMNILDTTCLNGELYIHGQHLQDITSAVKKPKDLSKQLTFAVFEAPFLGSSYLERKAALLNAQLIWEQQNQDDLSSIHFLTGVVCNDFEDVESHYNQCITANLEGTVVYLHQAPYEFNTRSSYVFKYKKAQDGEYQILNYDVDKNGHPVFHCVTPEGKTFKVKPKGTDAERKTIITNFESTYLNKWYKIEYETLSKDGVPLKGVGICLRDCDSNGNPLE